MDKHQPILNVAEQFLFRQKGCIWNENLLNLSKLILSLFIIIGQLFYSITWPILDDLSTTEQL